MGMSAFGVEDGRLSKAVSVPGQGSITGHQHWNGPYPPKATPAERRRGDRLGVAVIGGAGAAAGAGVGAGGSASLVGHYRAARRMAHRDAAASATSHAFANEHWDAAEDAKKRGATKSHKYWAASAKQDAADADMYRTMSDRSTKSAKRLVHLGSRRIATGAVVGGVTAGYLAHRHNRNKQ